MHLYFCQVVDSAYVVKSRAMPCPAPVWLCVMMAGSVRQLTGKLYGLINRGYTTRYTLQRERPRLSNAFQFYLPIFLPYNSLITDTDN